MIKVLKQMVEALEYHTEQTRPISKTKEAIQAGKQAVAEAFENGLYREGYRNGYGFGEAYGKANAPHRPWVGLTDEEKQEAYYKIDSWSECVAFIEAKLRKKNT